MYLPFFSVGLSLVLFAVHAQEEDAAASYPSTLSSPTSAADVALPGCNVLNPEWIGDAWCDATGGYNTAACGYDGGDCCECDCAHSEYIFCGSFADYTCVDPNSNCPSECSNGIDGFEGTDANGSVCCPLGCNQCGGVGCGQSGAGQFLDDTDCCIEGVLNNHDLCSVSGEAPCIV